jgi:hypothetical protein
MPPLPVSTQSAAAISVLEAAFRRPRSFWAPHATENAANRHALVLGLIRLDVRELHYLGPLLGLIGDEPSEVGGLARKHRAAHVGDRRLDLGIGEAGSDLLVELVDDFGGCVLRHADAEPKGRLVAWQEIAHGRDVGSASERFAVVTASARSLPALMCSMETVVLAK